MTERYVRGAAVAAGLVLLLSSCAGSPVERNLNARSAADFDGMRDEKLCHSALDSNAFARQARAARQLGDCSESYLKCKTYGFKPDDPEFAECRMMVDNRPKARPSQVYVPPAAPVYRPTMTTCRHSLGTTYCNTF